MFTSVMYDGYSPPPYFCFDAYCEDDLLMVPNTRLFSKAHIRCN